MTTEYAYVDQDLTVRDILKSLREIAKDVETIYYVYVTSKNGDLVGVISLRDILLADPDKKITDFMHTHIIKADINENQVVVAQKIAKYNLLALPVVEDEQKLKVVRLMMLWILFCLSLGRKKFPRMFGR